MTSAKQIAANRRNARFSTGPKTRDGKERSRRNATRHGLTAETVIGVLEDKKQYKAFEAAIVASYAPRSPVACQLAFRLASLLWRLRRATAIEAGLFQIQAEILRERRRLQAATPPSSSRTDAAVRRILAVAQGAPAPQVPATGSAEGAEQNVYPVVGTALGRVDPTTMAQCFLRLANLNNDVFERIGRYEAILWKQAAQTMLILANVRA